MNKQQKVILYFVVFSACYSKFGLANSTDFSQLNEMAQEFGEFYDESAIYAELEDRILPYSNYAEVVLNNAHDSEVLINQVSLGSGTNKAKVVQTNVTRNKAAITQTGVNNLAVIEQKEGDNNYAEIKQAGNGHNSYISQYGSDNIAYLRQCKGFDCSQTDHASDISIVQNNDDNFALVVDKGNSSYGIQQDGGDSIVIFSNMNRGIYVKQ